MHRQKARYRRGYLSCPSYAPNASVLPVLTTIVTTDHSYEGMKKRVKPAKKQRRIGDLQEAAFVDLLRTTDLLSRGLAGVLKGEGLSSTQYNVLRILRGAPGGLPCGEIARRMITRDPDITRLLDRLEKRSLISRCREAANRRTVMVRITPRGLRLLQRLNRPVRAAHRRQLAHMGRRRLLVLSELLEAVRGESGEVGGV